MEQQRHDGLTRPETLCYPFDRMNISTSGHRADDDKVLHAILDPEDEGISIDRDLHPDKDAFPAWEPFTLCRLVSEDDGEENDLVIHATNHGRFAIPILSNYNQHTPTIITNELLSLFDVRHSHRLSDVDHQKCVGQSLDLWRYCLKYTVTKSSFSFNEMLGTLALLYSIAQWLRLYSSSSMTKQYVEDGVFNSSIYFAYLSCVNAFHRCNSELTKRIETADKEIAARWQQALQKTRYHPKLLLSLPFSLPCP
ncbi:hypothetical protein V8E54_012401 [Elaphomyces granulatus]